MKMITDCASVIYSHTSVEIGLLLDSVRAITSQNNAANTVSNTEWPLKTAITVLLAIGHGAAGAEHSGFFLTHLTKVARACPEGILRWFDFTLQALEMIGFGTELGIAHKQLSTVAAHKTIIFMRVQYIIFQHFSSSLLAFSFHRLLRFVGGGDLYGL